MARVYNVLNSDGGDELPVTDGTYYTDLMRLDFETACLVIAFYDANGDAVTATAGTVVPMTSPISGQWQSPGEGDTEIDATTVTAGQATYTLPTFLGPAQQGSVTFANIAGVDHAKAYFWRV